MVLCFIYAAPSPSATREYFQTLPSWFSWKVPWFVTVPPSWFSWKVPWFVTVPVALSIFPLALSLFACLQSIYGLFHPAIQLSFIFGGFHWWFCLLRLIEDMPPLPTWIHPFGPSWGPMIYLGGPHMALGCCCCCLCKKRFKKGGRQTV